MESIERLANLCNAAPERYTAFADVALAESFVLWSEYPGARLRGTGEGPHRSLRFMSEPMERNARRRASTVQIR